MCLGQPLSELLQSGPLTVSEFDQLVIQALNALNVLHEKGLPHLALRPEAVRVTRTADERLVVRIGHIGLGHVPHMPSTDADPARYRCLAPEYWRQEPVGRRTDVYALGCIFYEALAGRPAFSARTLELMKNAHLQSDVTPLSSVAQQVQFWAASWVMGLLASNGETRPRHAKAARKQYELGIHGLQPSAASPAPAALPGMFHPYVVPTYGYAPPPVPGYTQGYMPVHAQPGSSSVPVIPVTPQPPARSAPRARSAPLAVARPVTAKPFAQKITPLHLGIGAGILLIVAVIGFNLTGKKSPPKPPSVAAKPAVKASLPIVAEPQFDPIPDAIQTSTVPRHERAAPPLADSLVCHLSAGAQVLTQRMDGGEPVLVSAAPGEPVYRWQDTTDLGGSLSLDGNADPKTTSMLPELKVVRIPPTQRAFPAITFHRRKNLWGYSGPAKPPSATSPGLPGITLIQVLRCRPVPGLRGRTVRVAAAVDGTPKAESNTPNVISIYVNDDGTFDAILGASSTPVPPVSGHHGQFCIVSAVWDTQAGQAQLFCRSAEGITTEGRMLKNVKNAQLREDCFSIGSPTRLLDVPNCWFNGELLDILIYHRALTPEERTRVESWLAAYYFGKP